jgi:hypothetical protein
MATQVHITAGDQSCSMITRAEPPICAGLKTRTAMIAGSVRVCFSNGTSLCQAAAVREETNLLNLGRGSWSAAMIFQAVIGVARETPVALLG